MLVLIKVVGGLVFHASHGEFAVTHHIVEKLSGGQLALLLLQINLVLQLAQLVHCALSIQLLLVLLLLEPSHNVGLHLCLI